MAIKNYTTKVSSHKTIGEIQTLLAKHGANRIAVEYGEGGQALGLMFSFGSSMYRLPSRVEAVKDVLKRQKVKCTDTQAENVAWRNIKDWIDAQIALVETEQVEMSEVMMPYMLDGTGKTLYESLQGRMLESGDA